MRRFIVAVVGMLALLTAGCTSSGRGSTEAPTEPTFGSSAVPVPVDSNIAGTPQASLSVTVDSCGGGKPVTRDVTYSQRPVVTHTDQVGLAPDASQRNALLGLVRQVSAKASGAPLLADARMRVEQHFGVQVAAAGQRTSGDSLPLHTVVRNRGNQNENYVLYAVVEMYSLRYSIGCDGHFRPGRFTTFGPSQFDQTRCDTKPTDATGRLAHRFCR